MSRSRFWPRPAIGWDDLLAAGLDRGFHETRQGTRYTIGPIVRQEILDRLLELNHARHAAEPAKPPKKAKKRGGSDAAEGVQALF